MEFKEYELRITALVVCAALLQGCLRYYTKYPKEKLDAPPAKQAGVFQYHIKPYSFDLDSGKRGLETALAEKSPFHEARIVDAAPSQGVWVDVEVKWRQPSLASLIFFYVSLVSYTIIPQWSTKEKFTLSFDVYQDSQFKQNYSYEVGRKGFTWLPLVVATWFTGTSPNQAEVFESVVFKFYDDAAPYFAAQKPAPAAAQ